LGIIPPFRWRHLASGNRQRRSLILENEEDNEVSSGCGLPIGDIQVFPLHMPFFCTANMRLGKEYVLDLLRHDSMLTFQLVYKGLFPDYFVETHHHTCS
jgi:hypothetical protein